MKTKFLIKYVILGRDDIWTICSITDPEEIHLSIASDPYFNLRADPVYARRLRDPEFQWNRSKFNCLFPVTYSRLNRVITIIPQTVDLYEVFDEPEYDSDVNHQL